MGKNIYEKQRKNPALVYCTGCGAPVEFDIIHQNYHCASCGANMAIDMPLQEKRAWRQAKQKEFLKHMNAMNLVIYVCPGCGAKVAVETKEALATCSFCGTQLVRREFLTSDVFPEMVIPFYLTLKEAENFLKKWAFKGKDGTRHIAVFVTRGEKQVLRANDQSAQVIMNNCIRCHTQLNTEFVSAGRVDFMMSKVGEGKACWDCHRNSGHSQSSLSTSPDALVPYPDSPTPQWLRNMINKK